MRRLRSVVSASLAVVLLGVGLTACFPASTGRPLVKVAPPLFPEFNPSVTDYVNRCDPATPSKVTVTAAQGDTISVNGSPPRTGSAIVDVVQAVGKSFTITLTSGTTTTNYVVRCLPADFPSWTVEKPGTPQAEYYATTLLNGAAAFSPAYSAIFDTAGVPVWWLRDPRTTILLTPLPNGNLAIVGGDAGFQEYELDGTLVRTVTTVGGPVDAHDVVVLPNGNYVLATVQAQACDLTSWGLEADETCLNHVFQELTPAGATVGTWDTSAHIPVTETTQPWIDTNLGFPAGRPYDPWHYNSIEWTGDGFIISFRHLDAIYKLDGISSTAGIEWKLGGTPRPESLTLVDDPLDGVSGQHDARWHTDGSVSLHDNGSGPGRQPRAVRYAIDASAGTATLVEEVRDAGVATSFCCGSARLLPSGNWVMGWGGTPQITENAPDGTRVFGLKTSFVYRGIPILPGALARADLRAGMDAQYAA